eukprot:GHVT01101720.1.p1 GENE.GHVT01101720.1~~GHVT01101720.1.p1  ORF type:complete len:121 (-),score=17.08 GHVT01101720.1:417-779(-)
MQDLSHAFAAPEAAGFSGPARVKGNGSSRGRLSFIKKRPGIVHYFVLFFFLGTLLFTLSRLPSASCSTLAFARQAVASYSRLSRAFLCSAANEEPPLSSKAEPRPAVCNLDRSSSPLNGY